MKTIRVDYHMHPCLPKNKNRALKKCQKWWEFIKKHKLNCVLITEHVFRDCKRAYKLMKETQPEDIFCFPGMEHISKEGIDTVIFSSSEDIYNYKELKSFKMTYYELIDFVLKHQDLHAFVTHPYFIGYSSVAKNMGHEAYGYALDELRALELSLGALDNVYLFLDKFPFYKNMFKKTAQSINRSRNLYKDEHYGIRFFTAGSDAHHFDNLGTHLEINSEEEINTPEQVFNLLIDNNGRVFRSRDRMHFKSLVYDFFIVLLEGIIKRKQKYFKKENLFRLKESFKKLNNKNK